MDLITKANEVWRSGACAEGWRWRRLAYFLSSSDFLEVHRLAKGQRIAVAGDPNVQSRQ
jgi:hypothetical protein